MSGAPTATTGTEQARRTGPLTAAAAVVLPLAVLASWYGDLVLVFSQTYPLLGGIVLLVLSAGVPIVFIVLGIRRRGVGRLWIVPVLLGAAAFVLAFGPFVETTASVFRSPADLRLLGPATAAERSHPGYSGGDAVAAFGNGTVRQLGGTVDADDEWTDDGVYSERCRMGNNREGTTWYYDGTGPALTGATRAAVSAWWADQGAEAGPEAGGLRPSADWLDDSSAVTADGAVHLQTICFDSGIEH